MIVTLLVYLLGLAAGIVLLSIAQRRRDGVKLSPSLALAGWSLFSLSGIAALALGGLALAAAIGIAAL